MRIRTVAVKALLSLVTLLALPVLAQTGEEAPGSLVWAPALAGPQRLSSVVWDGGQFVAVGDQGAVFTSPDGTRWDQAASGTAQPLEGAASGAAALVAVGPGGALLGNRGGGWRPAGGPAVAGLSAVAFAGGVGPQGLFVAVGARGRGFGSPDGSQWKALALPTPADLHAVAWGGPKGAERFVAVGDGGAILTSQDGERWTEARPAAGDLRGVSLGGPATAPRWVAVGQDGTLLQSGDGESWDPAVSGTDRHLNAVAWCGSRFVAVGGSGTILTSPDGLAWRAEISPTAAWLNGVAAAPGRIVAVGESGAVVAADTYTIGGTIVKGGSPLAGVTVSCTGQPDATTAADGTYSFAGLAAGTYTVSPALAGNVFYPTSATVVLSTASVTRDFAAFDSANITGTIYSNPACPLQEVTITATSSPYVYTTTTATGPYTLPVQTNRTYTVVASGAAYTFVPTSQSVPVATSDVPNITFTGTPHYAVTGTVTLLAGGAGLGGVAISVRTDPGGAVVGTATTAADGTYTVSGIANGNYTVAAARSGYLLSGPNAAVVSCADTSTVDFTAEPAFTIAGRVTLYQTSTGIGGITVTATDVGKAASPFTATTDASGYYTILNVPNGDYSVAPSLAGGGYTWIPVSSAVTVADANVTGINFQGQATRHITGSVTYSDTPAGGILGVTVTAAVPLLGNFTALTAADGSYEVTVPPASGITVTPSLLNHTFTPASVPDVDTRTADVSGVNFAAPHPPTFALGGTVTSGGAAFPNVLITATSTVARSAEAVYTATTGADGKYSIQALNGTYTVVPSLSSHAFDPVSRTVTVAGAPVVNVDFQESFSISGTVTLDSAGLAGVTVTAGTKSATTAANGTYSITGLVPGNYTVTPGLSGYSFTPPTRSVTLTNASQTGADFAAAALFKISGKVTLSGGTTGLAGVTISGTGSLTPATTGADGTYEFKDVPAGEYTLTPGKSGYTFSPATLVVTVSNADLKDKNFVATPSAATPTVTALSPTSGPEAGSTTVTVTGTNFDTAEGKTTVKFGASSATDVKVSATTTLTCKSPPGKAGQVDVTVTTPGGTSATGAASKFTYTAASLPTVTGISPTSGPAVGGTSVTVTGTNFPTSTGEAATVTVTFGDTASASVTVNSATSLTAVSPAHVPGQVDVRVTTSAGTSGTGPNTKFTYTSAPAIASVSPPKGTTLGGDSMSIVGSGFAGGATVTIGGAAATSVTVLNSTTIQCVTPAHNPGQADVKVTNPDGQTATSANAFTFVTPPAISSVKKAKDPFRLIITGSNFVDGCTVKIDNQPAPSTQFVDTGKVKAKGGGTLKDMVPKGVTKHITVVNPDGIQSAAFPYTR